jgi:hypothetical protein
VRCADGSWRRAKHCQAAGTNASVLTIATALVFGMLSGQVDRLEAGDPTPYMGLLERIGIGAWLLWLAVAAIVLLPTGRTTQELAGMQR